MLSLYKLYKHDMKKQHRAVTQGPRGKPTGRFIAGGERDCGSTCYRHKNVDWAVHRAIPAIQDREIRRRGSYGPISKTIHKIAEKQGFAKYEPKRQNLLNTSPRWGQGKAPRLEGRKVVPLPKPGHADVSKSTVAVGVGAVAVGAAGYYGYKHRGEIKKRVHKIENSFHHSHLAHTMHLG